MNSIEAREYLCAHGLQSELIGDGNAEFFRFTSPDILEKNCALFLTKKWMDKNGSEKDLGRPPMVLVPVDAPFIPGKAASIIATENPHVAFVLLQKYISNRRNIVDSKAIIEPLAHFGDDCNIGPYSHIGCDGLNAVPFENKLLHTPHLGGVIIGNHVRIGSCCTIERAIFGNTIIGDYTHIDHGVTVGHGSAIGKCVSIAPHVVVCGSCKLEDGVCVGAGATIRAGLRIGKGAFVGMGAVVTKDVEPETCVVGNPARVLENGNRSWWK